MDTLGKPTTSHPPSAHITSLAPLWCILVIYCQPLTRCISYPSLVYSYYILLILHTLHRLPLSDVFSLYILSILRTKPHQFYKVTIRVPCIMAFPLGIPWMVVVICVITVRPNHSESLPLRLLTRQLIRSTQSTLPLWFYTTSSFILSDIFLERSFGHRVVCRGHGTRSSDRCQLLFPNFMHAMATLSVLPLMNCH